MLSRGFGPLARGALQSGSRASASARSAVAPPRLVGFSTSCRSSKEDSGPGSGSKNPSSSNSNPSSSSPSHPQSHPSTKPPSKPKLIKSTKPSSKVNARTSRLLRSQLGTAGATPTVVVDGRSAPTPSSSKGSNASQDQTTQDSSADSSGTSEASEQLRAVAWAVGDDASAASHLPRLQEAQAFATASSYDFQALIDSGRLPPDWRLLEDGQVIYLPSWPVHHRSKTKGESPSYSQPYSGSGEVFILRTGAFVTWGMDAEQASRFRSIVLSPRNAPRSVERGVYEEIGQEEMDFVANEEEVTKIVGDVLVIGQPPVDQYNSDDPWSPLLARLSFSAGLALSARLSSQEASLSTYLASVQSIPRLLEEKGRVPISRREVVRKMGRLLKLRQMVNLEEGSKAEELELFWENAMMESECCRM